MHGLNAPSARGDRRQIAEALLCASRASHAAIGLFSTRRFAVVDAEIASAPAAGDRDQALPAIARSFGLLECRGREVDEAEFSDGGRRVVWLSTERCLIGLRRTGSDPVPFTALIRPQSGHEFPRWQREVARIGLLYECGRLDWSQPALPSDADGALSEIMSRLDVACALIDADRAILYASGAAGRWLQAQHQLRIADGRLAAAGCERQRQLAGSVRAATVGDARTAQSLVLKDDDAGGPPQVVSFLPLPAEGRALAIFGNVARSGEFAEVLLAAFGLTSAERRLACGLLAGRTLGEAAEDAGIQMSTAKGYLKAIFAKTGVHRQSEFIAVIGALVPPVWMRGAAG